MAFIRMHPYRAMKSAELASAESEPARAERGVAEANARARQAAKRKARTDRQGQKMRTTGSQAKIVLDTAKERSEVSGGSDVRLRARRMDAAQNEVNAAQEAIVVLQLLVIAIPESGLAKGRDVLQVDNLTFGYGNDHPVLRDVSLSVRGPERIAIEGSNCSGKSTLLGCTMGELTGWTGDVALHVPAARLDQDMSMFGDDETFTKAFARLDPEASENDRRAVLAHFLFRGNDA
ncbi:ATP-binding cassette domain-containing protein [uncultured Tateyamaria sp.]|nr:ATP-binding cassette domain-containing protein [uncultured Tateyamaria sp.]